MTTTEIAPRSTTVGLPLNDKLAYAQHLAKSGLLPKDYREKPANVLYAIEYGEMIGLSPMAALTGVHIIDGKPTASAALISALVRERGHRLRSGYDEKTRVGWAEIVRADDPEFTFRSEWDLNRAVTAELCTIDPHGNPHAVDYKGRSLPWKKFYPSMVKARATTEVARDACEEALFGLHYTPEELGADVDEDGIPIAATAERIRPQQPQQVTEPTDWDAKIAKAEGNRDALAALYMEAKDTEPGNADLRVKIEAAGERAKQDQQADEVLDAEVVDEPDENRPATKDELTALMTALRNVGLLERAKQLAVLSELVGREITAMAELPAREVAAQMNQLTEWADSGSADALIAELLSDPRVMAEGSSL
jgi:hypothetical protein